MKLLTSAAELEQRVLELGFLPFFRNAIPGFSVEEMADPALWFAKDVDGPWEWKGPVARRRRCAYGKFYAGKAMFVSMEWFPHFANWRRTSRAIEGFSGGDVSPQAVLEAVRECGSVLSPELKRMFDALPARKRTATDLVDLTGLGDAGYKFKRNSLERALAALQMGTLIAIDDFEYATTRSGCPYGWGLARYSTPEELFGPGFMEPVAGTTPVESYRLMCAWLEKLLPQAGQRSITALLR